jgi:hypothetical protein
MLAAARAVERRTMYQKHATTTAPLSLARCRDTESELCLYTADGDRVGRIERACGPYAGPGAPTLLLQRN